jgi:hypothetical protein
MSTLKIIAILAGALAVTVLIAVVVFFSTGGIFGDCGVEEYWSGVSPDSRFEVTVLKKNCGAATPISTHIFIKNQNSLRDSDNIFYVGADVSPSIRWESPSFMAIAIPELINGGLRYTNVDKWGEVEIKIN